MKRKTKAQFYRDYKYNIKIFAWNALYPLERQRSHETQSTGPRVQLTLLANETGKRISQTIRSTCFFFSKTVSHPPHLHFYSGNLATAGFFFWNQKSRYSHAQLYIKINFKLANLTFFLKQRKFYKQSDLKVHSNLFK